MLCVGSRQIKPSLVPWIAAQDAPEAHGAALEEAVFADGHVRVAAAGWGETAKSTWEKMAPKRVVRGEGFLVEADEKLRESFHHQTLMKPGLILTPL